MSTPDWLLTEQAWEGPGKLRAPLSTVKWKRRTNMAGNFGAGGAAGVGGMSHAVDSGGAEWHRKWGGPSAPRLRELSDPSLDGFLLDPLSGLAVPYLFIFTSGGMLINHNRMQLLQLPDDVTVSWKKGTIIIFIYHRQASKGQESVLRRGWTKYGPRISLDRNSAKM